MTQIQQPQGAPQEDAKPPPQKMKLEPDKLAASPKAILEILEKSVPQLKDRLKESDVEALARKDAKSIEAVLVDFTDAVHHLRQNGMHISADALIEGAAKILPHEAWKIYQMHRCVEEFQSDTACELFLAKFIPNMGKHIYWKPFVDKLNEYDEESIVAALMFEGDFETYLRQWDKSVVMAEEAICRFGFLALPNLELGRAMSVEIGNDSTFSTTTTGKVTIAPYVATHDSKEENMREYHVSFWHEIGHHKWKTFQINMDPRVFDYDSFGVKYVSHRKEKDDVVITVEKDGEQKEIRRFEDIVKLVKYPKLLHFLDNVYDDGRVDANNMEYCTGLADEYREDADYLLSRRPKLEIMKDDPNSQLAVLLEAILQYACSGRLRSDIPPEIADKFARAKEAGDSVEHGPHTDGTSSMNAAIKVHNLLMQDFDDLAKQLENMQMPESFRGSKTEVGGNNPPKITVAPPKKGRGRRGMSPFDFLNGKENGEQGENGEPGKDTGKPGKGGKSHEIDTDKEPKEGRGAPKEKSGEEDAKDEAAGWKEEKQDGQDERLAHYDGWDGECYVRNEHAIFERRAEGEVITGDPAEAARIRKTFQKYAPRIGVLERGLDEGEIDPELLQDYISGVSSGRLGERSFYQRVVYEERDVATAELIDLSGSTSGIRKEILSACSVISTASEALGDPNIVAGFTGGEGSEEFITMKEASEKEIKNSNQCGGTPMGGPLRHMCHKMSQSGIKHKGFKQIFLITDGAANVGKAPLEDAAKAVEEAWSKHRIKVFGIGITYGRDSEFGEMGRERMEEYFDKIFGVGNYLVVSQQEVADGRLHVFFESYYRRMANKLR